MLETILTTIGVIAIFFLAIDGYVLRRKLSLELERKSILENFIKDKIRMDFKKQTGQNAGDVTLDFKKVNDPSDLPDHVKQEISNAICSDPNCRSCTFARETILKDFAPGPIH